MPGRTASSEPFNHARLPLTRSLTPVYAASLAIALLLAIATLAGLLFSARLYPAEETLLFALPTDGVSLLVALPLLLAAMVLARRGRLLGLLCWPGALLYVLYIYLVYTIGVPLNALFLVYLLLVALSAYTTIGLVVNIDAEAVRQRLAGAASLRRAVPARLTGGLLAVLAALFLLMQIVEVIAATVGRRSLEGLDLSPFVADFIVLGPPG